MFAVESVSPRIKVIKLTKSLSIKKVLFVDNLRHNLLSISQLCDKGMLVSFTAHKCVLTLGEKLKLEGIRVNNVYKIDRSTKMKAFRH